MNPLHVVISLGFSRCGTTFLERALRQGAGYFSFKLGESRPQHPMKGEGLFDYVTTFRLRTVVLVYQSRQLEPMWESIQHAQVSRPGFLSQYRDLATVERLLELQDRNFEAFEQRMEKLPAMGVQCSTVRVAYEDFGDVERREAFFQDLGGRLPRKGDNVRAWREFFEERWMTKPATAGRLRDRLSGRTTRRKRRGK